MYTHIFDNNDTCARIYIYICIHNCDNNYYYNDNNNRSGGRRRAGPTSSGAPQD